MFYIGSIIKCGFIGGGVCLSIPALFHLKSFNDFYEIVDVYKISETDPILDCQAHGRHYKVYLTVKEGEKWDIANAPKSITLSVVDVKDSSNLSWGGTRQSQDGKWNNWGIRITSPDKANLQIPEKNKTFQESGYQSLACQTNKIVSSSTVSGNEVNITANRSGISENIINFKLEESSSCKDNGKRKECNILFDSGNNLKWKEGFAPKVYFYS